MADHLATLSLDLSTRRNMGLEVLQEVSVYFLGRIEGVWKRSE